MRGAHLPPGRDVVLPPGSERDVAFHVNNGRDWSIEVESIYYATDRQIDLLYRNQNRGIPASIGSSFSRRPGLYPGEYSGYYQFAGLGAMYEQATYGIFGNSLDGGKVMGLSAFSKSNNKQVAQIIQTNCSDDPYRLGTQWLFDQKGAVSVNSDFELAAYISSNVQESLELGVNKVMELARRLSGERHLCYSGGVALNGCANEKVIRSGIFKEVYIQPACNDAGTSIGCAFFGYAHVLGEKLKHGRYLDFTGKSYDDETEESIIRWQSSIKACQVDDLVRSACNLLCSGQIIGWYRGASEFGPRALGHRSILSLPHPISVKDKINIGSAGASVTLSEIPVNSYRALDTIEVPNIKFTPTQLDESIIVSSDIIITMTTSHKNCIFRDYGNFDEKKIFNLIELSNIILYFQSEKIYSRTPYRRARADELSKSKIISIIFSKISKLKEINREELITARNLDIEDPFGKPFSTYLRVARKIKENISIIFDYLFGV